MIARPRLAATTFLAAAVALGLAVAATPAQGKVVTRTFSSGNLNVPLASGAFTALTRKVKAKGRIRDVDLSLRLSANNSNADLIHQITLRSPAGVLVGLVAQRSGLGYGSGAATCAGTPTIFDDEGQVFNTALSPYAGRFQPDERLSLLDGYSPNGRWDLQVTSNYLGPAVVRAINCWGLTIRYKAAKKK